MVVGQIEAKMLLDRSNFTQGIQLTQHETSLLIPNLQAAARAEGDVAGGATKAGGAAGFLSGQFSQLAVMAGSYLGAQVLVNAAMSAFVERAAEVTAIDRDIVTMEKLGISTYGARKELEATGLEFVRVGQREGAAYTSYQDLLQATGNVDRATQLLNESLRFSVMWNEDVETVAKAVAKAYEHQPMLLSRLLAGHGLLSAKVKDFALQEDALVKGGEGANRVISAQAQYLNTLKVAGEEAKDTFADMSWNVADWVFQMELANPLLAEMGRQLGIMPTYSVKKPAKPWEWDRSGLMRMSFTPPPASQDEDTEDKAKKAGMDAREAASKDFEEIAADAAKYHSQQLDAIRKADREKEKLADEHMKRLADAWNKEHATEIALIDGIGTEFKSQISNALIDGEFNVQSFEKSFLQMLLNISMSGVWADIEGKLRGMMGYGAWFGGGGGGGTSGGGGSDWAGGDFSGGGGAGTAGSRGGYLPPMLPPTITRPQPTIVNHITVQGDVTRFAEFSENVVGTGLTRMRKLGR